MSLGVFTDPPDRGCRLAHRRPGRSMAGMPGPDTSDPDAPGPPETPPLTRLGERFRLPLGITVGVLGLALAVVFAIRPLDPAGGVRGVVDLVAGIALWAGVAAAGITWAAGAPRRVTNLCALGAIAAYVVMLFAGA